MITYLDSLWTKVAGNSKVARCRKFNKIGYVIFFFLVIRTCPPLYFLVVVDLWKKFLFLKENESTCYVCARIFWVLVD